MYVTILSTLYVGLDKSKYENKRIPATMHEGGRLSVKGSVLNKLCPEGHACFSEHMKYIFRLGDVIMHDKPKPKATKTPKGLSKYTLLTDGGYSASGAVGKVVMGRINERHPHLVLVSVDELNKHTTRIPIMDDSYELNFMLGTEIAKE